MSLKKCMFTIYDKLSLYIYITVTFINFIGEGGIKTKHTYTYKNEKVHVKRANKYNYGSLIFIETNH